MAELALPVLSASIVIPLAAAAAIRFGKRALHARWISLASALFSALCAMEALRQSMAAGFAPLADPVVGWLFVDALSAAPLALFAVVGLGALALLPQRDATPRVLSAILLLLASVGAAYTANNLILLLIAWAASTAPIFAGGSDRSSNGSHAHSHLLPSIVLAGSSFALAAGIGLIALERWQLGAAPFVIAGGPAVSGGAWAFAFLTLAMALRKGLFPFHSWVLAAFSRGPLLPVALSVNAHLGAYLVARVAIPTFPDLAGSAVSIIGDLALFTAIYAAVVALAERDPRRIIALLVISQASFILAGLETATAEGVAGGLAYWMLVTVATTSLAAIYRLLEVRVGRPVANGDFLGLAHHFPRLAVFFIASGLALVGLPGTLGFWANELLLHGALESHPQLGLALPLATALNAFHIYRLFSRLFLGSRGLALEGVPDARPVERWALTASLLFLIGSGLFPAQALHLRLDAAVSITHSATAASSVLESLLR